MRAGLTLLVVCAVAAPATTADAGARGGRARPAKPLPFRTVARGDVCCPAPGHEPPRVVPEARVTRRRTFVEIAVYAGRFPGRSGVAVERVTITRLHGKRQFRVDARLTVSDVLVPGSSAPYQVIRIRRSAVSGRVPTSAFLVERQAGFQPQTAFTAVDRLFTRLSRGGTLTGAVAVRRFSPLLHLAGGAGPVPNPVWYVRGSGTFRWSGGRTTKVGFFVIDDVTEIAFMGGYP